MIRLVAHYWAATMTVEISDWPVDPGTTAIPKQEFSVVM